MSVPQPGIAKDNSTIPRTAEDEAIFRECLPNMGTLYTLFPVISLTELPDDGCNLRYDGSGWCTCEFNIALLGKQLHQFSLQIQRSLASKAMLEASLAKMDADMAAIFLEDSQRQLDEKPFLHESDRAVAKGIIECFLRRRLLADSVRRGDVEQVKSS